MMEAKLQAMASQEMLRPAGSPGGDDVAIRAVDVSKRYRIGMRDEKEDTLVGLLARVVRTPLSNYRRLRGLSHFGSDERSDDVVWAVEDVSFELARGEALGIIGRNGAGKSTLLKILSRITEPTSGWVELRGRVSSLLEVGTGFHNELTGQENVFLNGAILGMRRDEIRRKFDEIVAFSGVERFIDTPIKRYSTGMKVRLAFAVAAHLEAEILIVDEVLAVGDAEFQKKCLGKMTEVSRKGRTVIFVSHNLSAIQALCDRAILLDAGRVVAQGTVSEVVQDYLHRVHGRNDGVSLLDRTDRTGSGDVKASSFRILDSRGGEVGFLQSGEDYSFEVGYVNRTGEPFRDVVMSVDVYDEYENRLLLLKTSFTNDNVTLDAASGTVRCHVQDLPLAQGEYTFSVYFSRADRDTLDFIHEVARVLVEGGDYFGTGSIGDPRYCRILKRASWETGGG